MTTFVELAGHPCTRALVCVPERGPWFADIDLAEAPELSGAVILTIGTLQLSGTIDDDASGVFGAARRVRLVAGAGGWGRFLPAKGYHNDASIRASTVAQDAAREAGESFDGFDPELERIGIDYVRQAGPAARALEEVIGSALWWVAYDGRTHVGQRVTAELDPERYQVLSHDPRQATVVLAVDDPAAVEIGAILSEGLELPETVRELEITATAEQLRVKAWCGRAPHHRGELGGLLRSIVRRLLDEQLAGVFKYRVGQVQGDRLDLQPVSQRRGLPTILTVSMFPGFAGVHAELQNGAHVLVSFVDGDRRQPVVTHFAGKDGVGWVPANITIDVGTLLKLGAGATDFVAMAAKVKAELDDIALAFSTFVPGSGGANFPNPYMSAGVNVGADKVQAE